MQTNFQLASVHGMLYTGGNLLFSPDGTQLLSPVMNYLSTVHLQSEGHISHPCSNSTIQCFDVTADGDLALVVGQRGLAFFYLFSARVVIDTISLPPQCSVACVKFSPCSKYVAIALENTLQVFSTPSQRTVGYHECHRVENYHAALSLPILSVEWTPDSQHLLLSGRDARMKILPRQTLPRLKRAAAQENLLVGHRSGVVGAWFMGATAALGGTEASDDSAEAATQRVVSVSSDNVVLTWRRTAMTRKEVLQAIAVTQLNARVAGLMKKKEKAKGKHNSNDNEEDEEEEEEEEDLQGNDDEEGIPMSFLEKQRANELMARGVRVPNHVDDALPPVLRYAYEIENKFMLRPNGTVMVADYHAKRGLLALGYSSGTFAIHCLLGDEIAGATSTGGNGAPGNGEEGAAGQHKTLPLVHLLSISAQSLTAIRFSRLGDHVAFGSEHLKQLLVWDWKAESYVIKEQAHYYGIARTAMTADSTAIISGGEDGKVKVWKTASGQCVVTFTEHTAAITGISTCANSNAIFTSSLDGTARAFDLLRYRHFRVFTAPEDQHTQFSCIAVDPSGEILAVGSQLINRIYLFAVQTGRIIDVLQGHETAISCLAFHPSGTSLVSGALDHNLVFWDLFTEKDGGERLKGDAEVLDVGTEVLCVTYSISGRRMAILTAKQEVTVYESSVPAEPELIKTFLTQYDAAGGWQKKVGPHSANTSTSFTRIAFSPEADKIIAGGDSKWIVMYHATQGYVLKKWPITTNLDILGAEEQFQYRSFTEAGFLGDIDVDDDDKHLTQRKILEMPGSRHPHFATGKRKTELVARAMDLCFAPTGTEFVTATTDGLLVFSTRVARPRFQPLQLFGAHVTTTAVRQQLQSGQFVLALIGSLILGDRLLGVECLRRMPRQAIPVAVSSTPTAAFPQLVHWVAMEVENSPGWELALLFAQSLLLHSNEALGNYAQENTVIIPALRGLQRSLLAQRALTEVARENYFSLQYLIDMAKVKPPQQQHGDGDGAHGKMKKGTPARSRDDRNYSYAYINITKLDGGGGVGSRGGKGDVWEEPVTAPPKKKKRHAGWTEKCPPIPIHGLPLSTFKRSSDNRNLNTCTHRTVRVADS
eukprot:gene12593-8631_t